METSFHAERPLGFQNITDLSVAIALTVPGGTALMVIRCEGQAVRYRDDGAYVAGVWTTTNPTASVGQILYPGDTLTYTGRWPTLLKFIQQAAGASLNVSFYGA